MSSLIKPFFKPSALFGLYVTYHTGALIANLANTVQKIQDIEEIKRLFAGFQDPEVLRDYLKRLGPWQIGAIGATAFIPFALVTTANTAAGLAMRYFLAKLVYYIGKPKLAIQERRITYWSGIQDRIDRFFQKEKPKQMSPIFSDDLQRRIENFIEGARNTVQSQGVFQNMILFGPGGTGKTMIARKIAQELGVNFVMMSGGDLAQFIGRKEHVSELNRLFSSTEKSTLPTVIFIDEAEGLAKKRDQLDPDRIELQNAFLNHTGVPTNKFMLIMATNRIDDLDEAILTRMDYKIHIETPQLPERIKILNLYLPQFFSEEERNQFFPAEKVQWIAKKTGEFSGRTLFKMMNDMQLRKTTSPCNQLTKELIDQTVMDFVKQEGELKISGTTAFKTAKKVGKFFRDTSQFLKDTFICLF